MIGLMVAPLRIFCACYDFSSMGTCAIIENGYGIQGQNYVVLLLGSEMSAGFHCRKLILGI